MNGIFKPNGKDLLDEYPELQEYPELTFITKIQRDFVWYLSCKSSPLIHIEDESERLIQVFKRLPEFKDSLKDSEFDNYSALNFPADIKAAIETMKLFNPVARKRASDMIDKIFLHTETVVNMEMPNELADRKVFMDIQMTVAKNIPSLLKATEQGYGTKAQSESDKMTTNMGDVV